MLCCSSHALEHQFRLQQNSSSVVMLCCSSHVTSVYDNTAVPPPGLAPGLPANTHCSFPVCLTNARTTSTLVSAARIYELQQYIDQRNQRGIDPFQLRMPLQIRVNPTGNPAEYVPHTLVQSEDVKRV